MSSNRLHFDISELEPLDVILVKGDTFTSKTTMALDGGSFSHAILHKMNGVCIEASPPLVSNIDITRHITRSNDTVKVLRSIELDIKTKTELAKEADRKFGLKYSLWPLLENNKNINNGVFCSMLVAYIYDLAGIKINQKEFNKVTPKDIEADSNLVDVTSLILVTRQTGASPLHYDYIENRERPNHLVIVQQTIYNDAFADIKNDYTKLFKNANRETSIEPSVVSAISMLETLSRNQKIKHLHSKIKKIDQRIVNSFERNNFIDDLKTVSNAVLLCLAKDKEQLSKDEVSELLVKTKNEIKDIDSIDLEWGKTAKLKSSSILKDMREVLRSYHTKRIEILRTSI